MLKQCTLEIPLVSSYSCFLVAPLSFFKFRTTGQGIFLYIYLIAKGNYDLFFKKNRLDTADDNLVGEAHVPTPCIDSLIGTSSNLFLLHEEQLFLNDISKADLSSLKGKVYENFSSFNCV